MTERVLRLWREEKLRFLIVGGWNTVFGYACFALAYYFVGAYVHYLVIGAFAHVTAVTQSFTTQRLLVFHARGACLPQYIRFHVSHLGIFAAGMIMLPALVELCGLSPPIAQGVWLVIAVISSYLIHKFYSFRQRA
jgi:putative flippase GtrA